LILLCFFEVLLRSIKWRQKQYHPNPLAKETAMNKSIFSSYFLGFLASALPALNINNRSTGGRPHGRSFATKKIFPKDTPEPNLPEKP
jgi:hypothetical protein